eukprot:2854977-Rhodomonas_salina.1
MRKTYPGEYLGTSTRVLGYPGCRARRACNVLQKRIPGEHVHPGNPGYMYLGSLRSRLTTF